MQVKANNISDNLVALEIVADQAELDSVKEVILKRMRPDVKIPGFRSDKAPLNLVEKNANPNLLQGEFMDEAINKLYGQALVQADIRPIEQPKVTVKVFVPFTQLTFVAEVPVIGPIELADYKNVKIAKPEVEPIKPADVNAVIDNIAQRLATKEDVNRAAKLGDEVWIDFDGRDEKDEPITGASSQNYPLTLGSKAFIPGFEEKLVGLKAGTETEFKIKFPADYGAKQLQNKPVKFKVSVIKVQSVKEPKQDDKFASKAGPFKTMAELKADIKKQLTVDRQNQARRDFESKLLNTIADGTKMNLPTSLIEQESERLLNSLKRNLVSRGQTFSEFLNSEGTTEEDYMKNQITPDAAQRLKASIILSEIAEKEGVKITQEEVKHQLEHLRRQYTDPASLAELTKPEVANDIASRLLAEKTIQKIASYST